MQIDKAARTVDAALSSVALARVIAEVRAGSPEPKTGAYNRTYNRHNR